MMVAVCIVVGWIALSLMLAILWWRFHVHIGHNGSDEDDLRRWR